MGEDRGVELKLWIENLKNLGFSVLLFSVLIVAIELLDVDVVYNNVMIISLFASVLGVQYVLSIRNPQNYTGFYPGVISSILLALQFYFQQNYDLTILYLFVFVPFQIISLINWRKKLMNISPIDKPFKPKFLSVKTMVLAMLVTIVIAIVDIILMTKITEKPFDLLTVVSALVLSTSVLANFLLIGKKIDAWFYWLLYSAFGMSLAFMINNSFNMLLFAIFIVINTLTTISWIKARK